MHPQKLSSPSPEQYSQGSLTHRPQTPQHSLQWALAGTHSTPALKRAHSGTQGRTVRGNGEPPCAAHLKAQKSAQNAFKFGTEKNRGSRITAAKLWLPAKGGLTQFGGAAGPQARAAPLLYLASHRWVPRFFRSQQQDAEKHICCFTRWSAPCVLPLAAAPLPCPQHPSAADKIGQWKTGSAGSCRVDFRFACARPA